MDRHASPYAHSTYHRSHNRRKPTCDRSHARVAWFYHDCRGPGHAAMEALGLEDCAANDFPRCLTENKVDKNPIGPSDVNHNESPSTACVQHQWRLRLRTKAKILHQCANGEERPSHRKKMLRLLRAPFKLVGQCHHQSREGLILSSIDGLACRVVSFHRCVRLLNSRVPFNQWPTSAGVHICGVSVSVLFERYRSSGVSVASGVLFFGEEMRREGRPMALDLTGNRLNMYQRETLRE